MVTVNVRFIANELTPGLVSGEYRVGEGSSIRELLSVCESACGVSIPEKNLKFLFPLFNSRPVTLDNVINMDGTLHLCRVVVGG